MKLETLKAYKIKSLLPERLGVLYSIEIINNEIILVFVNDEKYFKIDQNTIKIYNIVFEEI